ncbi:YgiQ family radical SAM protein [Clostridiaceae bacterium M8S5]|nr:YgiQ family radical SAM protein [Clostridiaceae bacterium M8S5]
MRKEFLPISKKDMKKLNIEELDFILVNGDAYVDHPSFGGAIISRVLESVGYKVGVISQPNWKRIDDFKKLGKPRLGFLVTGGNIDPMVNHYTVNKKRRRKDSYSPGGKIGCRPDRATIVYCNMIKQAYKDIPIIIGGIEASLRRFAHYDYWSNSVRRSILLDSRADLLIYGMGEKAIMEIAECLNSGMDVKYIRHIAGTCFLLKDLDEIYDYKLVPSYKDVANNKKDYAKAFKIQHEEQDPIRGTSLVQRHNDKYLVQNPPTMVLSPDELDWVYSLPYTRKYHPIYKEPVPAIEEVKFSIASSRGCYGGCSFCALTFHQGRIVRGRSQDSIIREAKLITEEEDFKGYIHDVGGPTANFREPACEKQLSKGACKNKQCLFPKPCKNLKVSHTEYTELLTKLRKLEGVKKVFVRSGLRYDYIMADKDDDFLHNLCKHHVSGQLKVAPEHIADEVLELMGKPKKEVFDRFSKKYFEINKKIGKEQYLIPYLMSSHPGSTLKSAIKLAEYLRDIHYQPEQVQDFYPTPGTLSTTMFYTGVDPRSGKSVYVPKDKEEKAMQRALLQFSNPKNYDLVFKALTLAKRSDLIGYDRKCLIKPKKHKSPTKIRRRK